MNSGQEKRSVIQPARPTWSGCEWVTIRREIFTPLSGPSSSAVHAAIDSSLPKPESTAGEQIDVHMVEAERQLQPQPQHARHDLDDLVMPRVIFPGVAQGVRGRLE